MNTNKTALKLFHNLGFRILHWNPNFIGESHVLSFEFLRKIKIIKRSFYRFNLFFQINTQL